jgi:hypothetical protein
MFEAYSIAVRISLVNKVSGALSEMSKQFAKLGGDAERFQKQLDRIKLTSMKGEFLVNAGSAGFKMFDGAIKSSEEYYHQLALLKNAGLSQVEVADAVKQAWATTHDVMSTKAADNIKQYLDLRSVIGEDKSGAAMAILPAVQRASAVLTLTNGAPVDGVGAEMVQAIKFGTNGTLNAEDVKRQAEMMSRAIIATNGGVSATDFHQAFKALGGAAAGLSDQFKYDYLPTLIQQMKIGKSGDATDAGKMIASLVPMIAGNQIPKAVIANWEAAGLVDPKKVVANPDSPTLAKILSGGVKGASEFNNPELYALKYIKPAIEALEKKKGLSETQAYFALTNDQAMASALQMLVNKAPQFESGRAMIEQAPDSTQAYQNLAKTDPRMAEMKLSAQWENLKVQLAFDVMPKLISAFNWLTPKISELVNWMEGHRTAVNVFVDAFLGLSAISTVAGALLQVNAAIKAFRLVLAAGRLVSMAGAASGIAETATAVAAASGIAETATAVAARGAAAAVGEGLLAMLASRVLTVGSLGLSLLLYSGGLDKGEDERMRQRQQLNEKFNNAGNTPLTPDMPRKAMQTGQNDANRLNTVAPFSKQPVVLSANLFLTAAGEQAIAKSTAKIQATQMVRPNFCSAVDMSITPLNSLLNRN